MITDLSWEVLQNTILESGIQSSYGPAGTGKTETFKDSMYYQGTNIFVLTASDDMSLETLAKLVSSVDESHTLCIDEFNRCTSEMMNNFVQLTKTDQTRRFFLTYNPGYAGRTKILSEVVLSVTN